LFLVKNRSLKIYNANNDDLNFATQLFVNTPQSAFHTAYFPVTLIILLTGFCLLASLMFFYPYHIRGWIIGAASIFVFILPTIIKWFIVFRCLLFKNKLDKPKYALLSDEKLPVYSVIIPLYKESKIFPELKKYLEKIDYPIEKLDIILLLEADDKRTLKIVRKYLRRHNPYHIKQLIIPECLPRTKPKAMNVALNYIKGEYFVIYDAEDRPDPLQIKKAASYFQILPPKVGALQAKLEYHNTHKTFFLTRMFTLEYDIWFNHFLQGIVGLKLPVPLSGTSTHMRTRDILKIGGWDAYNVTEDCDLGMRLNAANYDTYILDSITYEEAVHKLPIWIKQRTRWMKGYLQTLITHLRNPKEAIKIFGIYRFLGIYGIVGGQVFSALLYPACWIFYGISFLHLTPITNPLNEYFTLILKILMITGFILPIIQSILTIIQIKRKYFLIAFSCLYPLYWFFAGFAAYRAVWQLLRKPFKWEKTPHGHA